MQMIKKLIQQHYEVVSYLFFGGLATLLNLVLHFLFVILLGWPLFWANILNNILCILFAYCTNRTWVFRSHTKGAEAFKEFTSFVGCRIGTAVMDQVIMMLGVNWIGARYISKNFAKLWSMGVKIFSNVLVVVANYVFSKLIIFRKKQNKP